MNIMPPLVHIIDDNASLRRSLQIAMESIGLATQVYESAERFLDRPHTSCPDCIILDIHMPGMDGITLLQQLRASHCETPVIIVSGHMDLSSAVRSMKLGATDVLQKPVEFHALSSVVLRAIREGAEIRERHNETEATQRRFAELTVRELELLKLVVTGMSNKQIALELNISIKTVANHRAHLMAKTLAQNAADLARLSVIAGILPGR